MALLCRILGKMMDPGMVEIERLVDTKRFQLGGLTRHCANIGSAQHNEHLTPKLNRRYVVF